MRGRVGTAAARLEKVGRQKWASSIYSIPIGFYLDPSTVIPLGCSWSWLPLDMLCPSLDPLLRPRLRDMLHGEPLFEQGRDRCPMLQMIASPRTTSGQGSGPLDPRLEGTEAMVASLSTSLQPLIRPASRPTGMSSSRNLAPRLEQLLC